MRCARCPAPGTLVVHGPGGLPEPYCEAHAPLGVRLGDSEASRATAEAGAHANPASAEALYDLGAVRLREGHAPAAAALATRALALEPGRGLLAELLSEALEAMGDHEGAEAAVDRALALPGADGLTSVRKARLRAIADDIPGALAALEGGVARDPWCFEAVRRAGILRISRGEAEAALALAGGFLGATAARAAEVTPALPTVGPEAAPCAPAPLTVAAFPSELAYREQLRRQGPRRAHAVAAGRYQARHLLAQAHLALGREADAEAELLAAAREVEGVSPVLLLEVGLDLGE